MVAPAPDFGDTGEWGQPAPSGAGCVLGVGIVSRSIEMAVSLPGLNLTVHSLETALFFSNGCAGEPAHPVSHQKLQKGDIDLFGEVPLAEASACRI